MKRTGLIVALVLIGLAVGTLWWRRSPSSPAPGASMMEPELLTRPELEPPVVTPGSRVEYAPLRPRVVFTPEPLPVLSTNAVSLSEPTNALVEASQAVVVAAVVPEVFPVSANSSNDSRNLCLSNHYEIVWAANVWAGVHGEVLLPEDLMFLTNELSSPLALVCPADPLWSQKATTNWADFRREWITYRLHPDVRSGNRIARVGISFNYVFCPVHRLWSLGDRPEPGRGWVKWWNSMNPGKSADGPNADFTRRRSP